MYIHPILRVLNPFLYRYSFQRIKNRQFLKTLWEKEKLEIARNEQFLLFSQCFLLYQISISPFVHIFDIICLFAVELEESKIGILDKGLKLSFVW